MTTEALKWCDSRCYRRVLCQACERMLSRVSNLTDDMMPDESPRMKRYIKQVLWKKHRRSAGPAASTPSGVSKKKTSRPGGDDRLQKIAKAYGVEVKPASSRASVLRACLKKTHPDKKPDYTEADKDNHAYIVKELKAPAIEKMS